MEEYIVENYRDFDPIACFNPMIYQITRKSAEEEFKAVIDKFLNNEDLSVRFFNWCQAIIKKDLALTSIFTEKEGTYYTQSPERTQPIINMSLTFGDPSWGLFLRRINSISNVDDVGNDLSNMEASRQMTSQKIDDDHVKLIIESKCVLDEIIRKAPSIDSNLLVIPAIYSVITVKYSSMSTETAISRILSEFDNNAAKWFLSLFSLEENVCNQSTLIEWSISKAGAYDKHFCGITRDENFLYTLNG
ncbi:uncharacterized protein EV154DRAFT_481660 [Mucor mucedo]|uniref:uncharacterized protein n=1 Tax=Mucor mucedo TaxID=29922 RepID=UPI00221ED9F2|nr:uncharacterized protein EV154DRAFT_481660 [Mucor mucedo]KAI7891012.1 hypothetical protein EV154DRAFT_481660 [Mucor mucedo]